jgi:hypothetical protein
MSAGTIIACACKEIFLGKHSNLGPVDPQVNGIAAYAVLAEIETAFREISDDNSRAWVWNPILSNYTPGFVQRCQWAKQAAKEMVTGFLKENMFSKLSDADKQAKALSIFESLADLSSDKGHDKHIHFDALEKMGLTVKRLEDPADKKLQDLVLTVHHCYMYTLSNTAAIKIIESHMGRRWIKMLQMAGVPPMQLQIPQELMDAIKAEEEAKKLLGSGSPAH